MKRLHDSGSKYLLLILLTLFTSTGCYPSGTSVLSLNYKPSGTGVEPEARDISITLKIFEDARKDNKTPELIGHRDAAFNVSMGDVHSDKPVGDILYNAFSNELEKKGYKLVESGGELEITGKILDFWIGTDVTAAYWDVYGEVRIEVVLTDADGEVAKVGPYYSRNVERTYINPSIPIMERVILASINEVVMSVISENEMGNQ